MPKISLLREMAKLLLAQGHTHGYVTVSANTLKLARREELARLASQRVLLIAPHPDDDIFGAGGTLALLGDQNCPMTVLYLTDGVQGTVDARVDRNLKALRREEAVEALRHLAPQVTTIFWDEPDGALSAKPSTIQALATVIKDVQPTAIFYPNLLEVHPDHAVVTPLLLAAAGACGFTGMLWGYEIWTPAPVNTTIDITSVMPRKRTAMECHKSQLLSRPYKSLIEGLNAYRAGVQSIEGYAEAFMVTTPQQLAHLYETKRSMSPLAAAGFITNQLQVES